MPEQPSTRRFKSPKSRTRPRLLRDGRSRGGTLRPRGGSKVAVGCVDVIHEVRMVLTRVNCNQLINFNGLRHLLLGRVSVQHVTCCSLKSWIQVIGPVARFIRDQTEGALPMSRSILAMASEPRDAAQCRAVRPCWSCLTKPPQPLKDGTVSLQTA